jgi:hypothetical protein
VYVCMHIPGEEDAGGETGVGRGRR